MELNKNCPICLDLIDLENHYITECNHKYCRECIMNWFRNNNTCPVCRNIEKCIEPHVEEEEGKKYIRYIYFCLWFLVFCILILSVIYNQFVLIFVCASIFLSFCFLIIV